MATKEDILEQIVEEYLIHMGYFVQHNIKFRPRKDHPDYVSLQDRNHSDIDVLGFHPKLRGPKRVIAVNCKSWQTGFNPASEIAAIEEGKIRSGRERWKAFRELCVPKWSEAFLKAIEDATGARHFTYGLAVSRVHGDKALWETHKPFIDALGGNPIRVMTFHDMVIDIKGQLGTTLAATEVGRMLQLFKAAGLEIE